MIAHNNHIGICLHSAKKRVIRFGRMRIEVNSLDWTSVTEDTYLVNRKYMTLQCKVMFEDLLANWTHKLIWIATSSRLGLHFGMLIRRTLLEDGVKTFRSFLSSYHRHYSNPFGNDSHSQTLMATKHSLLNSKNFKQFLRLPKPKSTLRIKTKQGTKTVWRLEGKINIPQSVQHGLQNGLRRLIGLVKAPPSGSLPGDFLLKI